MPTMSPVGSAVDSGVPEPPPSASVQPDYLGDQQAVPNYILIIYYINKS